MISIKIPSASALEQIREYLLYDPELGILIWKKINNPGRSKIGHCAGYNRKDGYRGVILMRNKYLAHRLIWFLHYGEWPPILIDHINGNRSDNRIENIRLATSRQNLQNRKRSSHNKSGMKGVWTKRNKWRAQIVIDGKQIHLGVFASKEEAKTAYNEAAKKAFGEFYYSD